MVEVINREVVKLTKWIPDMREAAFTASYNSHGRICLRVRKNDTEDTLINLTVVESNALISFIKRIGV